MQCRACLSRRREMVPSQAHRANPPSLHPLAPPGQKLGDPPLLNWPSLPLFICVRLATIIGCAFLIHPAPSPIESRKSSDLTTLPGRRNMTQFSAKLLRPATPDPE